MHIFKADRTLAFQSIPLRADVPFLALCSEARRAAVAVEKVCLGPHAAQAAPVAVVQRFCGRRPAVVVKEVAHTAKVFSQHDPTIAPRTDARGCLL